MNFQMVKKLVSLKELMEFHTFIYIIQKGTQSHYPNLYI